MEKDRHTERKRQQETKRLKKKTRLKAGYSLRVQQNIWFVKFKTFYNVFVHACIFPWWGGSVSQCLVYSWHTAWCSQSRRCSGWMVCLVLELTSSCCFDPLISDALLSLAQVLTHLPTQVSRYNAWKRLPCCGKVGYLLVLWRCLWGSFIDRITHPCQPVWVVACC